MGEWGDGCNVLPVKGVGACVLGGRGGRRIDPQMYTKTRGQVDVRSLEELKGTQVNVIGVK